MIGFDNPPFNIFSLIGMVLSNGICGAAVPYIVLLGPLGSMDLSLEEALRGVRGRDTARRSGW